MWVTGQVPRPPFTGMVAVIKPVIVSVLSMGLRPINATRHWSFTPNTARLIGTFEHGLPRNKSVTFPWLPAGRLELGVILHTGRSDRGGDFDLQPEWPPTDSGASKMPALRPRHHRAAAQPIERKYRIDRRTIVGRCRRPRLSRGRSCRSGRWGWHGGPSGQLWSTTKTSTLTAPPVFPGRNHHRRPTYHTADRNGSSSFRLRPPAHRPTPPSRWFTSPVTCAVRSRTWLSRSRARASNTGRPAAGSRRSSVPRTGPW